MKNITKLLQIEIALYDTLTTCLSHIEKDQYDLNYIKVARLKSGIRGSFDYKVVTNIKDGIKTKTHYYKSFFWWVKILEVQI